MKGAEWVRVVKDLDGWFGYQQSRAPITWIGRQVRIAPYDHLQCNLEWLTLHVSTIYSVTTPLARSVPMICYDYDDA
jgi:hypothetical protein